MEGTKSGRDGRASPVRAPRSASCALTHRLFVRGLILPCRIGVHRHERDAPQRVRINVELEIRDLQSPRRDAISGWLATTTSLQASNNWSGVTT